MIGKLISNAVLSLVMDKQAKDKLHTIRQNRKVAKGKVPAPMAAPAEEKTDNQPVLDRQQLIEQAMAVYQTQSKIFDDLTLNEKRELQELAAKTLLGKGLGNDQ